MQDKKGEKHFSAAKALAIILSVFAILIVIAMIINLSHLLLGGRPDALVAENDVLYIERDHELVTIAGLPLAQVTGTHRWDFASLSWPLFLSFQLIINVLYSLGCIISGFRLAHYFYEIYRQDQLQLSKGPQVFRAAARWFALGAIVMPIASYIFYRVILGHAFLNLSLLLFQILLTLFLSFVGRLLAENQALSNEIEQFV